MLFNFYLELLYMDQTTKEEVEHENNLLTLERFPTQQTLPRVHRAFGFLHSKRYQGCIEPSVSYTANVTKGASSLRFPTQQTLPRAHRAFGFLHSKRYQGRIEPSVSYTANVTKGASNLRWLDAPLVTFAVAQCVTQLSQVSTSYLRVAQVA